MNLVTPTTQELSDTIVAQLEASLSQTIPLLPKAFIRVLAKVLAGVVILLYKYAGWISLQHLVQSASWRETEINGRKIRPLVELGRMFGVGDPLDGARAEHTIEITVLNQVGTLAAQSQLVDTTTGVIHLTTAPVALDAATKTVTIRAQSDPSGGGGVGVIGNMVAGAQLEFANAQANVAQVATVVSQDVVGAEAETESAYRARVLRRKQRPPQGGAHADYEIWATGVAGVANAYPYAGDLPGDIRVYVECTPAIEADGVAPPALLDSVQDAIQLNNLDGKATRRPIGAGVTVFAITRRAFNIEITGLDVDDQTGTRAELTTAVDQYLRTLEPFILGLSVPPRDDRVTLAGVSGVVDQIVRARSGMLQSIRLIRDAQIITAHTLQPGEKAKLASPAGITYV